MKNELMAVDGQILDLSKKEIAQMAESFMANADAIDTVKLAAQLAKFTLLSAEMDKHLKEHLFADLRKHKDGKLSAFGVDFSEMESGVKYDYSETETWCKLQFEIDRLKEKQKEVEAFCKALKSKTSTLDEETGELVDFYPPSKTSTTTIKKVIK
jgi:FtsZ-binding cell division protein ZapB